MCKDRATQLQLILFWCLQLQVILFLVLAIGSYTFLVLAIESYTFLVLEIGSFWLSKQELTNIQFNIGESFLPAGVLAFDITSRQERKVEIARCDYNT